MNCYKALIKLLRSASPAQRKRRRIERPNKANPHTTAFNKLRGSQILSVLITVSASIFIGADFVFAAVTLSQNIQIGTDEPATLM